MKAPFDDFHVEAHGWAYLVVLLPNAQTKINWKHVQGEQEQFIRDAISEKLEHTNEFDFMQHKVMQAIVDTAHTLDNMAEPFRAGGILALEELYFRITNGKHFDWEEFKVAEAARREPEGGGK